MRKQIIRKGENIWWMKTHDGQPVSAKADVDLLAVWGEDTVDVRPLYPMKSGETAITVEDCAAKSGNAIALGMRTLLRNDPVFPEALAALTAN